MRDVRAVGRLPTEREEAWERLSIVMSRHLRTAIPHVAVALLVLAGCGSRDGTTASGTDSTPDSTAAAPGVESPPVVVVDGEPLVGCGGGEGWPPSVMASGIESDFTDEARETFEALLADPQLSGELELTFLADGPETEFRVLREDEGSVTLGLGTWSDQGPADGAFVMGLVREGAGWDFGGGGSCELSPVLEPGRDWVDLHRGAPTDDPRTVEIGLSERQCTSARDPRPFLDEPVVVETDDAVTVYWTTTPMTEAANCQGNPTVRRPLTLDRPLGDRTVLDGSVWPPSVVPVAR